jgi:hypothetical protein
MLKRTLVWWSSNPTSGSSSSSSSSLLPPPSSRETTTTGHWCRLHSRKRARRRLHRSASAGERAAALFARCRGAPAQPAPEFDEAQRQAAARASRPGRDLIRAYRPGSLRGPIRLGARWTSRPPSPAGMVPASRFMCGEDVNLKRPRPARIFTADTYNTVP